MSDFWWGALFSAIVAGIVVPLFNHYLAKRREHQSMIRVSIESNFFAFPETIRPIFQNRFSDEPKVFAEPVAPREQTDLLYRLKGYTRLTLYNNSNKKLTGVTIYIKQSYAYEFLFQVDDMRDLLGPGSKEVAIGTILPGHDRVLHCWSSLDLTRSEAKLFANIFKISADELKDKSFYYPLPGYLYDVHKSLYDRFRMILRNLRSLITTR